MLIEGECLPKIKNCIVPFESQPDDLIDGACPSCLPGFALNEDGTLCEACSESITNCIECPLSTRCTKCAFNFIPSYNQSKCVLPFEHCNDKFEEYGNDGFDFVCQECEANYFWSTTERSCEKCPSKDDRAD